MVATIQQWFCFYLYCIAEFICKMTIVCITHPMPAFFLQTNLLRRRMGWITIVPGKMCSANAISPYLYFILCKCTVMQHYCCNFHIIQFIWLSQRWCPLKPTFHAL